MENPEIVRSDKYILPDGRYMIEFTKEKWWHEVGTLPSFCHPLRVAISCYLQPGYYSARLTPLEFANLEREVGPFVIVDGVRLRVVRTNEQLRLIPANDMTKEEWMLVWNLLEVTALKNRGQASENRELCESYRESLHRDADHLKLIASLINLRFINP